MKNGLGNLAVRDVDQLAAIMKSRLKRIQYRPALIDGFLVLQSRFHFERPSGWAEWQSGRGAGLRSVTAAPAAQRVTVV